jgi:hypothetical protein
VWVFGGSNTQNTKGTQRFILVRASKPYIQQYGDLRVRNAESERYKKVEMREKSVGDRLMLSRARSSSSFGSEKESDLL